MDEASLIAPAAVLWVLLTTFIANATATIPGGRGPPMDLGRNWPGDGRRILGSSKTWSGFWFAVAFAFPFGLLEEYLVLIAPPSLRVVPAFGPSLLAAVPVVLLLTIGGMGGDALGSFVKRRLGRASGTRTVLLDQMPFVLVPVALGLLLFPAVFVPTFWNLPGLLWLLFFTLVLHTLFNWLGYRIGWKKVPW